MNTKDKPGILVRNLKGNGRKKLLGLGKAGAGKSAICNALCQPVSSKDIYYPENAKPYNDRNHTMETLSTNVSYLGNKDRRISLIDTIGFDNLNDDADRVKPIADLVNSLYDFCDYINLFGIVINGTNPRIEPALVEMIELFEELYRSKNIFWESSVVIFTNMHMSAKEIQRRQNIRHQSDHEYATDQVQALKCLFSIENIQVRYILMDSKYDVDDGNEVTAFQDAANKMYEMFLKKGCEIPSLRGFKTKYKKFEEELEKLRRVRNSLLCGSCCQGRKSKYEAFK